MLVALVPLALTALPGLTILPGQGPKSEEVFKNIQSFKGVPANDLIPAMEFMCASMDYKCMNCHNVQDFAAETEMIKTTRRMIDLQRDINEKHFNGRLEVTCMTCHNKKGHPVSTPLPAGITIQHEELINQVAAEKLVAKHMMTAGLTNGFLVLKGTLTAPNDQTHEIETKPLELIQGPRGEFRLTSPGREILSDGSKLWYGGSEMTDEPRAIFSRLGRTYSSELAFSGLNGLTTAGKNYVGKDVAIVAMGFRPATQSAEQMLFAQKSGLLVRVVNVRRSTIGNVVSAMDYADYRALGTLRVPMRVTFTSATGDKWVMRFTSVEARPHLEPARFRP
jgi:hypothetical protein